MKVTEARFIQVMNDDDLGGQGLSEKGCNAIKGLLIVQKYLPDRGIEGANHDVIYSVGIEALVEAGITEADVVELRHQNWMLEDDTFLACFV